MPNVDHTLLGHRHRRASKVFCVTPADGSTCRQQVMKRALRNVHVTLTQTNRSADYHTQTVEVTLRPHWVAETGSLGSLMCRTSAYHVVTTVSARIRARRTTNRRRSRGRQSSSRRSARRSLGGGNPTPARSPLRPTSPPGRPHSRPDHTDHDAPPPRARHPRAGLGASSHVRTSDIL